MSFDLSYQQQDYLNTLNQNMTLRKEIQDLIRDIQEQKRINKRDAICIADMTRELTLLEDQILNAKSRMLPKTDSPELRKSMPMMGTSNLTIYTRSSSLKKLLSKDYESVLSPDCLTEETGGERFRLFESFHSIGLRQKKGVISEPFDPDIIFSFPETNLRPPLSHTNLINSAFPFGICCKSLNFDDSITSQVNEVLYHSHYRNGNSFITIMENYYDLSHSPELAPIEKKTLFGCFVVFDDIKTEEILNNHYIVPHCYCILTYFPSFELHFDVIYRLLAIKRAIRFNNSQQFIESGDMSALLGCDRLSSEELGFIENYYDYFSDCLFEKNMRICIPLQSVESIDYTFPSNYTHLEKLWFCPLLFSVIELKDFYYIFCALLQEKKVMLYSQNLDILTSCILGFLSLLSPFKWRHFIAPLFQDNLADQVKSASSFFIGAFREVPSCILDSEFFYMNLDTGVMEKNSHVYHNEYFNVEFPSSRILTEEIDHDYAIMREGICYSPSETQLESSKNIISAIENFITWIISELTNYCNTNNILDFQVYQQIIAAHAGDDRYFLSNILNTEMFMYILKN